MRTRPQFGPAGQRPDGSVTLRINGKMRRVLSRLLTGLPDALIRQLAGPVASPVKAFGEKLAETSEGTIDAPAVDFGVA